MMEHDDPLEFAFDGTALRIDRTFARNIENSLSLALDEAYEHEVDLIGEPFCGCNTCVARVMVSVAMVRTVEGLEQGLVERIRDGQ